MQRLVGEQLINLCDLGCEACALHRLNVAVAQCRVVIDRPVIVLILAIAVVARVVLHDLDGRALRLLDVLAMSCFLQ